LVEPRRAPRRYFLAGIPDARVYAAPKGYCLRTPAVLYPGTEGGRLLLYVELFPDFLAFVFYQYEVEAGLEAFAVEVLEVPGREGVLGGSAEARAEVAAGREDGDGGLWRQTPERDS